MNRKYKNKGKHIKWTNSKYKSRFYRPTQAPKPLNEDKLTKCIDHPCCGCCT